MLVYRSVNEHQNTINDDLKKMYLVSNMAILGVSMLNSGRYPNFEPRFVLFTKGPLALQAALTPGHL